MKKVVDANYLSDPKLLCYLEADSENKVIFCDHSCMEAYKGNALVNIKKSIEIVAGYPNQVFVLKGTRDIVKVTLAAYSQDQLFDVDQTVGFANFCNAVSLAAQGDTFLRAQILRHQENSKRHFQNILRDAEKFAEGIKAIEETFTPKQLRDLRTEAILDSETVHKMVKGILWLAAFLCEDHPSVFALPSAENVRESYIFRYAASGYLLALRWISKGGLADVRLEKLRNDIVDMGCVAYATLFDGILTNDKKMQQIYEEVLFFLEHAFQVTEK